MRVLFLIAVFALAGCSTMQTTARPNSYYQGGQAASPNLPVLSLAAGKKTLSNKDFQSVLLHRYKLPKLNRVAVVALSGDHQWRTYSPEIAKLASATQAKFYQVLRKSKRVYDVSPLPRMIMSSQLSSLSLRAAAANYQADLLLVYRVHCNSFQKYKLFAADKTQSYCTVDAMILDTRTGITPFAISSTNTFSAVENKDDARFRDTIKKAELQAIEKSLLKVGEGVLKFLATTKTR